jgi:RNA 2',3'-cyclic 3'-phosphodiesterase
MRLFTAIEIPADIKGRLQDLAAHLRPLAKLSWSPVENLHVTTKFIGEWPEDRLQVVKDTLAEVAVPRGFEIAVQGLGWFPNARNPKVFWAGIESGPELAALAKATESALASIGVPVEDREYHPHLTLARRRNPVPIEGLRKTVESMPAPKLGSFHPSSFILYLSAAGKYTKLQEYPFVSSLC